MSRPIGPEPTGDHAPPLVTGDQVDPGDQLSPGGATDLTGNPLLDPIFVAGLRGIPSGPVGTTDRRPASDIVGVRPDGSAVEVRLDHASRLLLVAFLYTRCDGCDEFWRGLADDGGPPVPGSVDVVIVTKGPGTVSADEVGARSAGITRVPVVMSDDTWSAYEVLGYPFFVLVDPASATVVGETVGFGWSDVASMVAARGY